MMRSVRRDAVASETRDGSLIRCCCSPAYRHSDTELQTVIGDGT